MNNDSRKFALDGAQYSPTEEFGLGLINDEHKQILSVGISTAGFAEIRMAIEDPQRKIVATTLDKNGLEFSKKLIKKYKVDKQLELIIQDISSQLPYKSEFFDFIYARLVLHYLPKKDLKKALKNIYKILKNNADFYLVVRSYDWESEVMGATYDNNSGITTYPNFNDKNQIFKTSERHLQSVGSISSFLTEAGFKIGLIRLFSEIIFSGYIREKNEKNKLPAKLIAIHAKK